MGLAEGCFCPDGHILFNSHTDICVPKECRKPGPYVGGAGPQGRELWPGPPFLGRSRLDCSHLVPPAAPCGLEPS